MSKKPGTRGKNQFKTNRLTRPGKQTLKSLLQRHREYQRQIEVFESKNSNRTYDAILHYLKAELEKLNELIEGFGDEE